MIKFIVICLLIIFVVARFFGYIQYLAYLLAGKEPPKQKGFQYKKTKTKNEEGVEIRVPQQKKTRKRFKGGEYIDYEEIEEDK